MELVLFDEDFAEIGIDYPVIDFETGDSSTRNNFEVSGDLHNAHGFSILGTEIGGIVEYEADYNVNIQATRKGFSWRGLLSKWILDPPEGEDYKTVSGEANAILRGILSGVLGGFFEVPKTDSGLTIDEYQFKLYTTVLDGLMDMLEEYGYRLKIYTKKVSGAVKVYCEAVPATVQSGVYDSDVSTKMKFTYDRMGINHLICMGSGELQNRMRLDLYINEQGKVSEEQYYYGFEERQQYYDYGNAQSLKDLKSNGKKKLKELASSKKLEVFSDGIQYEIGDILKGKHKYTDKATGKVKTVKVEARINKKIYKISNDSISVEYGIKEVS